MKTVQAIIDQHGGMDKLKSKAIKIDNPPYMALCIEYIGQGPRNYPMVSAAHHGQSMGEGGDRPGRRQNGDAMRDPDMVFEVAGPEDIAWGPISFRNDYAGVNQLAVWMDDELGHVMLKPGLIKDLRTFARTWDRNLKEQGFLREEVKSV